MRIYSIELLAATAILAWSPSSSGIPNSKMEQVDRPTADRSHVDARDGTAGNRLRAIDYSQNDATNREERAPLTIGVSSWTKKAALRIKNKILSKLHATPDTMLATIDWATLKQLDGRVVTRYTKTLEQNSERRKLVTRMLSREPDGLLNVMYLIRIFEKEQAVELMEKNIAAGISALTREDIVKLVATEGPLQALYPASLHNIEKFVHEWNAARLTHYTLLNLLEEVFGGVAKLAPALSIAKRSHMSMIEASQLQSEMLTTWLNEKRSIDDVFGFLELSELRTSGLTYENLDTLFQYIARYKIKHADADVNTLTYLRQKFGHIGIVRMIMDARAKPSFHDRTLRYLVQQWVGEGNSRMDVTDDSFAAAIDESKVLELMTTVCGGVANLAQALTKLKANPLTKLRAEYMQTAMVTSWLNHGKSVKHVYDFLDLPDPTKDVWIYENLDSMRMYGVLYHKKYRNNRVVQQYVSHMLKNAEAQREEAPKRQRLEGPTTRR